MGQFANKLSARLRGRTARPAANINPVGERLRCVGIIRGDKTYGHGFGFRSHWELRAAIDAAEGKPRKADYRRGEPGDIDGFITTDGWFLNRREAQDFAVKSGQLSGQLGRELLSSDLKW